MNKQAGALIALFAGWILTAEMADATTYKDIAGQWCGDVTDYVFTPNSLTVKFHDTRPANVFKITKYTYANKTYELTGSTEPKSRSRFSLNSAVARWRSSRMAANRADLSIAAETSSFLLWSPTCFWKFGPRAKQGMRPLLAHEVRLAQSTARLF